MAALLSVALAAPAVHRCLLQLLTHHLLAACQPVASVGAQLSIDAFGGSVDSSLIQGSPYALQI
ncbi:hypothetical protein O6H91_Y387100 [Diphasiastrum complanatum]|nr:hypothetical protein O6H91_Y387100 [Diphasiastrum complanatum]